jgi:Leucine-rich repeat (LRR) protein
MLAPLRAMVKQPQWDHQLKRFRRKAADGMGSGVSEVADSGDHEPFDSPYSLDSDEDLDVLHKSYMLNLNNNALLDLPPSLWSYIGIQDLSISNNNLSQLPANIYELRSLASLNVNGNRLRWLPGELIDLIFASETEVLKIFAQRNPLLQPFSYVGLRSIITGDKGGQGIGSHGVPLIPNNVVDVKARMSRIKEIMPGKDLTKSSRDLLRLQQRWLCRMYEHYLALPEMIWLGPSRQDRRKWTEHDEQAILAKWYGLRARYSFPLETAFCNMYQVAYKTLCHQTIRMAATPVCYLDISGRPINAKVMLPSEIPMDQTVLSAQLLAVPMTVFKDFSGQSLEDRVPHPQSQSCPVTQKPRVHSLFSRSLASASTVPELHQLPSLLPEDTSDSVRRGLDHALQARREGGRTCYACKRVYVVPRAEWLEYHVLSNTFEDERYVDAGFEDLFVPFLRRVCSWGCVPQFEFDDQ